MSTTRPIKVISVDDIKQIIPDFELKWLEEHKNDARVLLFNLGMDTDFAFEIQKGLKHRSQLCGVTDCPRIVGHERVDKEWTRSRFASDEAKMYTPDKSMAQEMRKIQNRT